MSMSNVNMASTELLVIMLQRENLKNAINFTYKRGKNLHYESSQVEKLCSCLAFHLLLFKNTTNAIVVPQSAK